MHYNIDTTIGSGIILETWSVLVLIVLAMKEFIGVNDRLKRVANLLYLPALPLLVLFGISAFERIREMPSLTG